MAKNFLNSTGLAKYNAKIKEYITAKNAEVLATAKSYVDGKDSSVKTDIDNLKQLVGETSVATQINNAKTELENKIGTVTEGKTLAGMIADNAAAIDAHKTAVDDKVTTLIGSDTDKSVREIANEELAAQLIPEGAKDSLDTLQEIASWIQNHPDDASAMNTAIAALQAKTKLGKYIPEGQTEAIEYATVEAYVEAIKRELETNTNAELAGKVDANERAIAIINGDSNTEGSINKALADAKAYADNKIQSMTSTEIEAIIAAAKTSQS